MNENGTLPDGLAVKLHRISIPFHPSRSPLEASFQWSSSINSNRPRFRVDMCWSATSEGGVKGNRRMCTLLESRQKRSASSDVLPPEMPPLWCGPLASLSAPRSRLWASIGSAWWMCAPSLSLSCSLDRSLLLYASRSGGSQQLQINILALLSPLHLHPPRHGLGAACPHVGRGKKPLQSKFWMQALLWCEPIVDSGHILLCGKRRGRGVKKKQGFYVDRAKSSRKICCKRRAVCSVSHPG